MNIYQKFVFLRSIQLSDSTRYQHFNILYVILNSLLVSCTFASTYILQNIFRNIALVVRLSTVELRDIKGVKLRY